MKKVLCLMVLWIVLVTSNAQAVPISGLMTIAPGTKSGGVYVSGSYFAMGGNNPNASSAMLQPGSAGGIVLGTYQNFVLNPDTPHPYNWDGKGAAAGTGYSGTPTTTSTLVLPFNFFGTATYTGTNPISYQSGNSHPAPTADVDGAGNLSMELSSWEVMWNGSAFEQGPRPNNSGPFVLANGTYDSLTGAYNITWASQIKGGPFNGVTGYWHLEGVVVPEPSSLILVGSGLIGLVGIYRKRTTK